MPFVETLQGVRIHYETAGEGPPLVFLHGWGMSGRVWSLLEALAERYRLVVPDLRGHGISSAPDSGYTLESFAEDLAGLFRALHLENATLIAWSMGAQVALQAYPMLTERLAALALVCATPRFTAGPDYPHGLPSVETKGMAIRLKRDRVRAMGDFSWRMFTDGELHPAEQKRIADVVFDTPPSSHVLLESLSALVSADLRAVLPSVSQPVLLMHGGADTICVPSASRYMAMHLPNARLVEMEGVGHAPFLSRPEEFMLTLTEFLDGINLNDRQV